MKYHKLVENAHNPHGFWGRLMIRSMNRSHSQLTDWALSYLRIERSSFILDVGCGGGKTVEKLCSRVGNGKVYGIDISELCVKTASALNEKNIICGKAKITEASVSDLPFDSGTFDIVTAVEAYYFWQDKLSDLKEIHRVMKSGGRLLLVFEMLRDPDNPEKWNEIEKTAGIKAVDEDEITDILMHAGYVNVRIHKNPDKGWLCTEAEKE